LGTAKLLQSLRGQIKGNVKLLFQPAEETDGGADRMIQAGCMENPHVDFALGLHVAEDIETGQIMIKRGALTASSDVFSITVQGRSAHGAYPDDSVDAVVMAAHVVTDLQTIVARNVSPLDSGVVTLGTINGGTKENIIADRVVLTGTARTLNPATRKAIKARIVSIATGVCQGMGGDCSMSFKEGYMPIINHDEVVDVIEANALKLLGKENLIYKEKPSMGVEDFAFFCHHVPGAFYYLGCGNKMKGINAPGHSPTFQIDEDCLKIGVLLQTVNTLTLLG
jgi:amidohydrolase